LAALGKSERQGRCPELTLWVLIFMLSTRLLDFFLLTSGVSGWPDREQEAPSAVNELREGYADVRDIL